MSKITITSHIKFQQGLVIFKDGFEAISASFDGTNDFLTLGAGLTGAADSTKNLTSIWFKVDDAGGDGNLMVLGQSNTSSYSVVRNVAGKIEINLESSSTVLWNFTSTESYNSTTNIGWHNLLFAADLGVSPTASVFVDNEVLAGTDNTAPTAGDIDYTVANWAIGASTAGTNKLTGELSEYYMTDEFLDITILANRLKFIDTTGGDLAPAFLGVNGSKPTGNVPIIFFTGSIDDWHTNVGFGGGFTENGELVAGSDPIIPRTTTVNFTEGSLFTWGYDGDANSGLMGISTTQVNQSSPVQVGALTNWVFGTGGTKHSFAIKSDNTLWAWGYGGFGVLGNNANGIAASRSSPVQVPGGATWADASAGERFSLGVKTDGTLWSWGDAAYGVLGTGGTDNTFDVSIPVQITGASNWASVTAGSSHSSALTTTGELWMWGTNAFGELGQGDTTYRSSPVQVGTGWAVISCGQFRQVAVKTDGSLWSWGYDGYGALGLGTVNVAKNSPTQIGALTDWADVVANQNHSTLALKTDGTLWGWGYNAYASAGILGVGDVVNHNSPVQVGADTNWAKIGMTNATGIAIRTDGTLWAWGFGYSGALDNNISNYYTSSPIQIGSDANWAFVARTGSTFAGRNIAIRDTNG